MSIPSYCMLCFGEGKPLDQCREICKHDLMYAEAVMPSSADLDAIAEEERILEATDICIYCGKPIKEGEHRGTCRSVDESGNPKRLEPSHAKCERGVIGYP